MMSAFRRVAAFAAASATITVALLAASAFGGSNAVDEAEPPPPDVAFMDRTGLGVRFVQHYERLPVGRQEAVEIGGRGAPAEAWLVLVEPAGEGGAPVPGLQRLSEYVEYEQPLWFVVIDQEPDLGEADEDPRGPRPGGGPHRPWFNIAFVDPYTGSYVLGLAGLTGGDEDGLAPGDG